MTFRKAIGYLEDIKSRAECNEFEESVSADDLAVIEECMDKALAILNKCDSEAYNSDGWEEDEEDEDV